MGFGTPSVVLKTINLAKGLTPTALGWIIPPSNLDNATDEDIVTATGEGKGDNSEIIETEDMNKITLDLGNSYIVLSVCVRIGLRTSGMTAYCKVRCGETGTLSDELIGGFSTTSLTSVEDMAMKEPAQDWTHRYITIRTYANNPAYNPYLIIYEIIVVGYKLPLSFE